MRAPRRRPEVPPESRITNPGRMRELLNGYEWPFDSEPDLDDGPTADDFAQAWERVRQEQPITMRVPSDPEGDVAIYAELRFRRRVQHARLRHLLLLDALADPLLTEAVKLKRTYEDREWRMK